MNLKCVDCNREAEYLVTGTSFCKEHLPSQNKSENILTDGNFQTLEKKVDSAINEGRASDLKFDKCDIYSTKFMQKVAETSLSKSGLHLDKIYFVAAFGITFALGALFAIISIMSSTEAIGKNISLLIGLFIGFVFGILLLYIARFDLLNPEQRYNACIKIILNAERRIQVLSKEDDDSNPVIKRD